MTLRTLAFAIFTVGFLPAGHAQTTITWDGGGGDDLWGTGANWVGDSAPSLGDVIHFAGSTRLTPDFNYGAYNNMAQLFFDSGAGAFTLGGNSIRLQTNGSATPLIQNDSTTIQIVQFANMALNNSGTFDAASGDLTIRLGGGTGFLFLDNNSALTLRAASGKTLLLDNLLANGGGSTGSLVIDGSGTVIFARDNTYSGTTTLNSGSTLEVGNGGTTGTLGSGNTINSGTLIFDRSNDSSYGGVISGVGTLTKQGAGTLTLTGANTYGGKTTISGGTLSISSDGNLGAVPGSFVADQLTIDGGTLAITAALTIAGNRGITIGSSGATFDSSSLGTGGFADVVLGSVMTGTGAVIIAGHGNTSDTGGSSGAEFRIGSGNTFIGDVTITSGMVSWIDNTSFGNTANDIILAGGGLLATTNRTLPSTRDIVLSGGGDRIFRVYNGPTLTIEGNITGSGNVRHTDGGTLQLNGDNSFTGNLLSAAGGTGTIALAGDNSYTGITWLFNSNTVRLDADDTLPDTTAVLMYANTNFNLTGHSDTIRGVFVGSAGDANATVNLGAVGSTGTLTVTNNSMPGGSPTNVGADMYAKITGSGNVEYDHATTNNATWNILNNSNDFIGNWIVSQGRLRVDPGGTQSDAGLGASTNDLIFNGAVVDTFNNQGGAASFQVTNGNSITFGVDRSIILNSGREGTFYVWGGTTHTVEGQITGGGNLRKEDSGVLLLNNTSSDYTGETRIVSGTLRLGAAGVLPDGTLVRLGNTSGVDPILDTNGLTETVAGFSSVQPSDSQVLTDGRIIGGGTVIASGSGSYEYGGRLQLTTMRMDGTGTQTLSGNLDNNGGMVVANNGTVVLAKASNGGVHAVGTVNTTGLTINGGTVQLGGTGNDQIYTETHVEMTGGVFDLNDHNEGFRVLKGTGGTVTNNGSGASVLTVGEGGAVSDSYTFGGALTDGSGTGTVALTKLGDGTLTLSGTSSHSGATTVSGGTLLVTGNTGSGSAVTIQTGATLGGTGTVGGTTVVDSGATLTGGAIGTTGTLAFSGDLTASSGSTWLVDLVNDVNGQTDLIDVSSGTLDITNATLSVADTGTFTYGNTYTIANYNSLSGTFAGLAEGDTFAGTSGSLFEISYTGGSITLTAVPEPGTVLPLAALLAPWLLRRRRR